MKLKSLHGRKFRKGLTLIEISIVVMLVSMLFIEVFASYFFSLKIAREADPPGGVTRTALIQSIENLRLSFTRTYFFENQKRLLFVGKSEGASGIRRDKVSFASSNPNSEELNEPSVKEVSFYLKRMENKTDLFSLIRREDDMVDNFPLTGGTEHVLIDNVKSFQLKYSERGDKWLDEWNSKSNKKIPRLIRIEIIALVGNEFLKYESLAHPGILFK
ncbi:MAG: type II secretion system protein GspJ [Leptospiraceae bacterium]|nr:type II secretion system protein GspJ [Leptospiraceae bacterium]